jgi:hypothetical protein
MLAGRAVRQRTRLVEARVWRVSQRAGYSVRTSCAQSSSAQSSSSSTR